MVRGIGARLMKGRRISLALALVAGMFLPGVRAEALLAGTMLTNFVYGTFQLASGLVSDDTITGRDPRNVTRSASAWVLVTNEAQQCMAIWKVAQNPTTWAMTPQASPGERLCFTISYSNCGTSTAYAFAIYDITPANVTMSDPWDPIFWPLTPFSISWRPAGTTLPFDGTNSPVGVEGPLEIKFSSFTDPLNKQAVFNGVSGYINYCVTVL